MCWCGSMAEQLICNQQVDGSTPFTSSKLNNFYGGIPERPKGADCKSVVTDFAGPNPASPTNKKYRVLATRYFLLVERGTDAEQARVACAGSHTRKARIFSPRENTQLPRCLRKVLATRYFLLVERGTDAEQACAGSHSRGIWCLFSRFFSVPKGRHAVLPFKLFYKMRDRRIAEGVGYFLHRYFAVFEIRRGALKAQSVAIFRRSAA